MRIAVVGAGISGLTCAHRLATRGHEVTVFEREADVGGRMRTVVVDGLSIDVGANVLLANYEALRALADEVGIGDTIFTFESGSGGVLRDEELTSFTPKSAFDVLRYRGVSLASRVKLLRFFLRAYTWRDSLDFFDLSVGDDDDADRDAFTVTSERMGVEIAEYLIDPFVRTFHFHGAHRVSMKLFDALAALFVGKDGFVSTGFRGFMSALPRALAARLDVRTGHAVRAVEARGDGGPLVDGAPFDRVVLATPAPIAKALLVDGDPRTTAYLAGVAYAPTIDVAFRVPRARAADFEGIWVPYKESVIVSECANDACKGSANDDDVVFTMGLHEETAGPWLGRDDDAIAADVAREWTRLFPAYEGALTPLLVTRWPHAMPVYSPAQLGAVRAFLASGQGARGVWLCGDHLNHPWVEGAIRCGEAVARAIDDEGRTPDARR